MYQFRSNTNVLINIVAERKVISIIFLHIQQRMPPLHSSKWLSINGMNEKSQKEIIIFHILVKNLLLLWLWWFYVFKIISIDTHFD